MFTPAGSTSWVISVLPDAVARPISVCAGAPFTSSSATTKISSRDGSMTGVPVIPTVGVMSPHGRSVAGTGVPRCVDHATAPVLADRAYTVSFSVATYTRPPKASGSP